MPKVIDTAREQEVIERALAAFEPCQQAPESICHEFELHRPTGLLLNNCCSVPVAATSNDIVDLDLYDVAAAKLAVDRKIKQRAFSQPVVLVQEEADRPNVA